MRALVLALFLLACAPSVLADEEHGSTAGLNLGFVSPGVWDVYALVTPGGAVGIDLQWEETGVFPFADYDLRLYRPGAMSNGELSDGELIAESSQHPYAHHSEHIDWILAAGTYHVAVVPFQAQLEEYTLRADPADLVLEANAFGYVAYDP